MQTFSYQQLLVPPHPCSATRAEEELQSTRVCRSGGPSGALVPRMSDPRARGAVWRRTAITTGDSGHRHPSRDRPMEDAAFEKCEPERGRPRPGAWVTGEYATAGEPTACNPGTRRAAPPPPARAAQQSHGGAEQASIGRRPRAHLGSATLLPYPPPRLRARKHNPLRRVRSSKLPHKRRRNAPHPAWKQRRNGSDRGTEEAESASHACAEGELLSQHAREGRGCSHFRPPNLRSCASFYGLGLPFPVRR